MSVVFHVMKEEYDRLVQAAEVYKKNIAASVRGSEKIKHIGKNDYLYLQRREGKKVIHIYIGALHSHKAASVLDSIKKRKKNEESLKKVLVDIKEIKKVLRGKI